ncbi:hypothetical protein BU14_0231s0013 [Porphyra umbilicalis]|uniref:Uncharacterized protein n=1 Tax=Porphyra umbilicalis TaxID=2786 RepID=A0A1X6P3U9_PORUM|nr:hypothetical protein BU14_0231s0013 [Porphyra umbilicalis]|eukprot:OSX75559.1 hypothetical protein BU14_0231s0013 [Porphyra umbilicalis]
MNNLQSWKNGSGYYSANAVGGPHAEGSPIGQAEPSTERDGSLNGRGHLQGCSLTDYTSSVARQRRALSTHADHQQDKFCLTPCISRPPYPGGCFCRAQVRTVFEGATGCTSSAVAAARAAGSEASSRVRIAGNGCSVEPFGVRNCQPQVTGPAGPGGAAVPAEQPVRCPMRPGLLTAAAADSCHALVPPPPRLCFGTLPSGRPRRVPGVYSRNPTPRIQWRGPPYPCVCPELGGTHPLLPDGAPVWLCGVPRGGRLVASVRQPCGAVPRCGHTEEGHTPAGGLCGTRRDGRGRPARPPALPPPEHAGERHRPAARCLSGHRRRRSGFRHSHPTPAYACV